MNLIDLDVSIPHAKCSNHCYYCRCHLRMKMAEPPIYPPFPLLSSAVCLYFWDLQGQQHLQLPVEIENMEFSFEIMNFWWSYELFLTLNFKRIGVSFSCRVLLHSSNASKSIGNLMSFKIFALIPSLPLYWNRTKFTVR